MPHEPDLQGFRVALLQAIERGNGTYSWYHVDRLVVPRFPWTNLHLMPLLRELEEEGSIETIPNAGYPGQPTYRVRRPV